MEEIKQIVAKNIVELRKAAGMTQLELAEALNYSDKAISKWERGESLPDVAVLKQVADLFHVTIDFLVSAEHRPQQPERTVFEGRELRNRKIIMGISILLVWSVATIIFVALNLVFGNSFQHSLAFICAVPASLIVALIFNCIWFNPRLNFLIISILMWSMLACVHLSLLFVGFNVWQIYIPGIPGQIIILLWSGLKLKKKPVP